MGGGFCAQCAAEIDHGQAGREIDGMLTELDRALAGRVPLATVVVGALSGVLGRIFIPATPGPVRMPPSSQSPPRSRPAGPPPSQARPAPPPDPRLLAREILGFEATEKLSRELVEKRRKALARVFHSDLNGGSDARMKKVNAAADLLLAKLS